MVYKPPIYKYLSLIKNKNDYGRISSGPSIAFEDDQNYVLHSLFCLTKLLNARLVKMMYSTIRIIAAGIPHCTIPLYLAYHCHCYNVNAHAKIFNPQHPSSNQRLSPNRAALAKNRVGDFNPHHTNV